MAVMTMSEFPLYIEYSLPPTDPDVLRQHVADQLTGNQTTVHDRLYDTCDVSAAPDIDTVPESAVVYRVTENGEVSVVAVATERGVLYSHSEFDLEQYRKQVSEDEKL